MSTDSGELRVAMVGHAFMGAAHSQAWRVAHHFFALPLQPVMQVVVGRDAGRAAAASAQYGWAESSADWRSVVERDDIDVIDICTPGDSHAEIAIAALAAGKHVMCEKPLAGTVEEAEQMASAAAAAYPGGSRAMVGFTYRRVPAVALARQLVLEGRIGDVHHVRAQYLQDWLVDPTAPLSWRLDKARAGSGALGDIGAHAIDLSQHITGLRISEVVGRVETFVAERPDPQRPGHTGRVSVDDAAVFLTRYAQANAVGVYEASRFASGRKNALRIEINGSKGSLAFDFEDMNVLEFHDRCESTITGGFKRILVTEPEHPYVAAWWPPGHGLGYEHGFTHQVVDFVRAIASGDQPTPSFHDGLGVQRVLAAVASSSETGTWQEIPA